MKRHLSSSFHKKEFDEFEKLVRGNMDPALAAKKVLTANQNSSNLTQ